MTATALVVADVGPEIGVGHVTRCLALGDELRSRGFRVVLAADTASVPWLHAQVVRRGVDVVPAPLDPSAHAATVGRLRPEVVVVDSYRLPPEGYAALGERTGCLVALVDDAGADVQDRRPADLHVDQNLSALDDRRDTGGTAPEDGTADVLRGPRYALLRDEVLAAASTSHPRRTGPQHVVAFFGGTDPRAASLVMVDRLLASGVPLQLTAVVAGTTQADAVRRFPTRPGQRVSVLEPTWDLPALLAGADAVVSACGTSVLELLHLGVPTGVVQVADNQARGYASLVAARAVVGLGRIEDSGNDVDDRALRTLLTDARLRERLGLDGPRFVDGLGRRRVVDRALEVAADRPRRGATCPS